MKRQYTAPKAEIEKFTFVDIVTESPETTTKNGIIDGGEGTTVDDDF